MKNVIICALVHHGNTQKIGQTIKEDLNGKSLDVTKAFLGV